MKPRSILESVHKAHHFPLGETRRHSGEPCPEVLALPYYDLVPKDTIQQLKWREIVYRKGAADLNFRHAVAQACEEDLLFFANTVGWVFEPRIPAKLPLNTWRDQDDHLMWMDGCWGVRNCGLEKSRDCSITWNGMLMFLHHWLFDPGSVMKLITKTDDQVDSMTDPDSLIWKLQFLYDSLPRWMTPDVKIKGKLCSMLNRTTSDHRFYNRANGSVITGYPCTGGFMRGGRGIAAFMDEFADWEDYKQQPAMDASAHAAKCRYIVSTFSGNSDCFYKMMRNESSTMLKLVVDWRDNPIKARGLYTSTGGRVQILDNEYDFPADYKYVLDGKIRSPYYDAKCTEPLATPQSIARELDRDPLGASAKLFPSSILQKMQETVKNPYFRCEIDFDPFELEPYWTPKEDGRILLWMDLDRQTGKIGYRGPFAVGVDVGTGAGSSNTSYSAIIVWDIPTGEQVLRFADHTIQEVDFAKYVLVMMKWLCGDHGVHWCYLNFEYQGPGVNFWNELRRLGWLNTFRSVKETVIERTRTETPGYINNDGGRAALKGLQQGVQEARCIIRDARVADECGQYEEGSGSKAVHASSATSGDAASQGKSHGDCAIAAALGWMALKERAAPKKEQEKGDPYVNWTREFQKQILKMDQKRPVHRPTMRPLRDLAV